MLTNKMYLQYIITKNEQNQNIYCYTGLFIIIIIIQTDTNLLVLIDQDIFKASALFESK